MLEASAAARPVRKSGSAVEAIKIAKRENPDYGIKRVCATVREKGLIAAEKRVKKLMQDTG
jgi:hypothetical protein